MSTTYLNKVRRPYAHTSSFLVHQLHLRNPWVPVWWSMAFPGGGHMMLCKYFTGAMLMLWEFVINVKSNINIAIMLSMTGQFSKAKDVLDPEWFFLYMGVYLFAMWDSYRLSIDMNKLYLVADREDASILPVKIPALETNYFDVRKPWTGVIWSMITPGLGQIYFNRLYSGFYLLIQLYCYRLRVARRQCSPGYCHRKLWSRQICIKPGMVAVFAIHLWIGRL